MNCFIIIILAFIQGIAEFLPISSSGHLVLFYKIFNINNDRIFLSVILHLATLLSVLFYYRKSIIKLIKNPLCHTNKMLILSTIFTVIIVLIFKTKLEESFDGKFLSIGFFITAILLLISQLKNNKTNNDSVITELKITPINSIIIGISQGLACFPGISRSGTTIACGLLLKCDKTEITEYSFLMSIPIIIASTIMEILDLITTPSSLIFSPSELFLGFFVSFIIGLLSINLMTKLVKNQKLYFFSFYLIIIALISTFI